jgi:hypothetical protein
VRGPIAIGFPSSSMESDGPARSPSLARRPFTLIRPAEIQISISRREPRPAAASSFWIRSAVGAGGGLLFGFADRDFGGGRSGNHLEL